ncbi:MAG: hypothetical protein KBG15_22325 [Kofleriaceae bacterium]|nr:hypothetical protein [Kofleriaceae bacterium]
MHVRWLVRIAATLVCVCSLSRPAFADDSLSYVGGFMSVVIFGLAVLVLGFTALVAIVIRSTLKIRAAKKAEAELPRLPCARALPARSQEQ